MHVEGAALEAEDGDDQTGWAAQDSPETEQTGQISPKDFAPLGSGISVATGH